MNKPVGSLNVDMELCVESGINLISQNAVRPFQHDQLKQPEEDIDQEFLDIKSQSNRDRDETTNKSYSTWGKINFLKETKHCFHTDFRCNKITELNGKAFPERSFESMSPERNTCPSLDPAESKSVKENPVNNLHSRCLERVKSGLPDLWTETAKPVSKKLMKRRCKALQKSATAKKMVAQRKDNKPKSKYRKILSNIPKQNNRFACASKLLAETEHGVQRNKAKRKKPVNRRNNLNVLELGNLQGISKTRIFSKHQGMFDKDVPTDEVFDNVKHGKINPDEKLLNVRKVSRHKILQANFSASRSVNSEACKNSAECIRHRTMNSKEATTTLETVSTKAVKAGKKKLKPYRKTCSNDCQTNERNNADYHANNYVYYKSDSSIDFLEMHTVCFNCNQPIRNSNLYAATSPLSDNCVFKNYTLQNHSCNILNNIDRDGLEILQGNDFELTDVIQSSLIYDGNDYFNLVSDNNRNEPVCIMNDSSTFNSDVDCFTIPAPIPETSGIENEIDFVITDVFSLSGLWDSISNEVPYIENGCWELNS